MTPEEFRTYGYAVVDWVAHFLENTRDFPVLPDTKPGEIIDSLPPSGPEESENFTEILADFEQLIVPRITHWNHPRFLGYFANSSPGEAILAEMLAATLNPNAMLWKSAPAAVELEQVTLDWLRQWIGLSPGWFGQILDTASTSTLHAIIAARVRKGFAAMDPRLVLYASSHAHSSIEKGALAAGMARDRIRLIEVDSAYRLRLDSLSAAIMQDLASGLIPFCVIPTIGTTSVASIDPVPGVLSLARQHGLWVHIDCAYAGSVAIAERYRPLFAGMDEADSCVINPHKWLFLPMDLSVLYCREARWLRDAFSLVPEYLRTTQDPRALNYHEYGLPLGRRFRSLKLWFVLRAFGRRRLAALIHQQIEDAKWLAAQIAQHPYFEVCAPVEFSLVVFRHKGGDAANDRLLDMIHESGKALLSPTVLDGRKVIRHAIGTIQTTRNDIRRVWDLLQQAAAAGPVNTL
ncbi:MAG: pyridoxal phosphate-dependent decarboxylase family protein [Acidobacteriota bacterium]